MIKNDACVDTLVATLVAGLCVVVFGVTAFAGCGSTSATTRANVEKADAYGDELAVCIDHAKTLEESRACRCAVVRRWGREAKHPGCADGGVNP